MPVIRPWQQGPGLRTQAGTSLALHVRSLPVQVSPGPRVAADSDPRHLCARVRAKMGTRAEASRPGRPAAPSRASRGGPGQLVCV